MFSERLLEYELRVYHRLNSQRRMALPSVTRDVPGDSCSSWGEASSTVSVVTSDTSNPLCAALIGVRDDSDERFGHDSALFISAPHVSATPHPAAALKRAAQN